MNRQYHWGIIGAGNIAHRFAKSLQNSSHGKLYAIASHTESKRNEFKKLYPQIITYYQYDDLLNDSEVDIVYIATWHNEHYQWAKKALLAHKAVLCEKPATLSLVQMKELANIAKQEKVFFMEAMKTRMIPAILELKNLLNQGVIGDIKKVENRFCYNISQAKNTRYLFDEEQGGILRDVGSYTILSLLDYIHAPVKSIQCQSEFQDKVDIHDRIEITFESGQLGYMEIAMNEKKSALMTIFGTKGQITCTPFYRPTKLTIHTNDGNIQNIYKEYIYDDFFTEIEEVHICLGQNLYESSKMSLEDSIRGIQLLEQIKEVMNNEI